MSVSRPLLFLLLLIVSGLHISSARVAYGPETQRDRLHRLMHAEGADIHSEDAEAKKIAEREQKAALKGEPGPMDQESYLHAVGMHGDKNKKDYEPTKDVKDSGKATGPCVGMDCLHGVLMHGDSNMGESHEHDHAAAEKKEKARDKRNKEPASVEDPHEMLHGQRKSIAETADDYKRYASHRPKDAKGPIKEPIRLEFEPGPEETPSYWQSIKNFFKRALEGAEEEEEPTRGEDMDMLHDLESIGRTGEIKSTHSHDRKSRRQERDEHKSNAHREH